MTPGHGTEDWVTDYQNNYSFALAPSPDGSNVYVAGTFTAESSVATTSCSASACGYSMTAYDAHSGPGVVQDRDPSPHYDGWRTFFDRTALGGAYRASRVKGQRVVFKTPVTRSVVWIAHRGRAGGQGQGAHRRPPQGDIRSLRPGRVRPFVHLQGSSAKGALRDDRGAGNQGCCVQRDMGDRRCLQRWGQHPRGVRAPRALRHVEERLQPGGERRLLPGKRVLARVAHTSSSPEPASTG